MRAAKVASRFASAFGSLSPVLHPFSRLSLRLDRYNPVASFAELNRRTGGEWGLKNVVFEKDPELFALFMQYGLHQRAQILQDLAYLKHFGVPDRGGFFVEVGVGDGIHLSNTHLFEKQFGWDGLLVEPNPAFHDPIRASRSASLETSAAFDAAGSMDFVCSGELSGLTNGTGRDHRRREGRIVEVPTATLTEIFQRHSVPERIQFLSIDTEGSELNVLQGLDFTRYAVDFVVVEHNFDAEKREAVARLMADRGFRNASSAASLWDDWFVRLA
ncbi:FkbM family methyltransferase [Jiella pacifica]|uniref:FkbM family methyltransferase n=1 Tax=Jiella pacifica TaxID=2696469 RepID=A0A6N9SZ97_9HYPH|nr:FkbM family methyltransferase [Jiella pacifica]NDW04367.1 FkbM family methyltransferase [Jiella pacifica]